MCVLIMSSYLTNETQLTLLWDQLAATSYLGFDKLYVKKTKKTIHSSAVCLLPLGLGVGVSNQCASVDARKSAQMSFIWLDAEHIGRALIIMRDSAPHIMVESCTHFYCMYSDCAQQPSVPLLAKPHMFSMDEKSTP